MCFILLFNTHFRNAILTNAEMQSSIFIVMSICMLEHYIFIYINNQVATVNYQRIKIIQVHLKDKSAKNN